MYGSNFTKGYLGVGFHAQSSTDAFVLGTDANLWHETGPWGTVPPKRQQVDGNVAGFQPMANDLAAFVLGADGNLWYETGPWGTVPPPRQQVDGNVAAFQALSPTEAYVLGSDGNLWHETGPWGTVPPKRQQVDGNVAAFQAVSSTEAFVLGSDGNLWLETGPWDTVPPSRIQIGGGEIVAFQALGSAPGSEVFVLGDNATLWLNTVGGGTAGQQVGGNEIAAFAVVPGTSNQVYVLGTDGTLWLNTVGKGTAAPQVDGNVIAFQALDANTVYVLGSDGNLWHETGPWGTVPPTRQQVDANVWSGSITINTYPNISGLNGTATLNLYASGAYSFSGGWSPSNVFTGVAAQDVNLVFTLLDSHGTLWAFSTAGTVPVEGSYNFNNPGTNVSLAQNWQFLSAGYTWHDDYSASIDLIATGQEIINWYNQNKQTIDNVVQVVGEVASLVASL